MKRKFWKIRELDTKAHDFGSKYDLSPYLVQVLINRGLEEEDFDSFLKPQKEKLHSPKLLPDIEKADMRIKQAIKNKEKVLVFGDYDVDGITSLVIFHEFAKDYEDTFTLYIPHRVKEGYGLNPEAILKAKEEGVSLIITFDCGSNAGSEIELAQSLSIDVIVIDHHIPSAGQINPYAFVNPKREGSKYPFTDLSAGALSFKLLQVLKNSDCWKELDLVALSLVCDVVPLRGENRILLKEGLNVLRKSSRFSIKALCKVAGIKQENIDTFHIGYILGPRINASGRVAHASFSLALFLADDETQALKFAKKLGEYNRLRQSIEAQILKEAESKVEADLGKDKAIVVSGSNWHPGVLGIVASRLANKYSKPSFVISFDQEPGVGSARSVGEIHLMKLLDECADSLIGYGGHKKAAGVQIEKDEMEGFKEKIKNVIEDSIAPEDFIPALDIDALLPFEAIDMALADNLENLKPFGEGNQRPLFVSKNINKKGPVKKVRYGYSVWLTSGSRTFEGTIYDKDLVEVINSSDKLDIAFSPEKNDYHKTVRLVIRDCRFSDSEG